MANFFCNILNYLLINMPDETDIESIIREEEKLKKKFYFSRKNWTKN